MVVLIYGGSFDPPHRAHMRILQSALDILRPDLAYVVPAFHSPLKPGARAAATDRLRMLRLALGECIVVPEGTRLAIETYEIRRRRKTYTYQTLRHLRSRHPGAELHFLVGSDALKELSAWKRPSEVRSSCRFLIARRPGGGTLNAPLMEGMGAAVTQMSGAGSGPSRLLPRVFPDIASTRIRSRILAGIDASALIPGKVLGHIEHRRLYGLRHHDRLTKSLSRKRYRHCVAVSRQALDLAGRHRLDGERAAEAGLLHDCGLAVPRKRMGAYARRLRLDFPELEETARQQPRLLHAHIGERIARTRFKVSDRAVLDAIRRHVIGEEQMTPLDRLLYVADVCSEDRDYPQAAAIRRTARKDLDAAFKDCVRLKLMHVLLEDGWMHPLGPSIWNRALDA